MRLDADGYFYWYAPYEKGSDKQHKTFVPEMNQASYCCDSDPPKYHKQSTLALSEFGDKKARKRKEFPI
eukprot:6092267-Amphidinium_carterae.1